MNSAGEHHAALGWFQRSSASMRDDLVVREIDQRLVGELELARRQRVAQVELERAARLDARIHVRLEEAEGAAPFRLGAIEREVGAS